MNCGVLYSTDSSVTQNNHASSEGTIQIFTKEKPRKTTELQPEGATGGIVTAGRCAIIYTSCHIDIYLHCRHCFTCYQVYQHALLKSRYIQITIRILDCLNVTSAPTWLSVGV